MKSLRPILFCIAVAAAALPALAAPGRFAITTERIAAAITNRGVQITPDQVTLFTGVVASVANPELKVESIDRSGNRQAIARIACADSAQCLPFMVSLRVNDGASLEIASTRVLSSSSSFKPVQFAVRQGTTTALYLDGTHVHISLSVICLESGIAGQTIRASSLDRHQVFTVQVAGDGTLRGRL
ncbi:MAG TPA: hypothetical protein VHD85_11825 [Terracidiphilus sp.]|nr:hypothetical protein [Terracidiphilus sp.]